jgi:hypothetical protein
MEKKMNAKLIKQQAGTIKSLMKKLEKIRKDFQIMKNSLSLD